MKTIFRKIALVFLTIPLLTLSSCTGLKHLRTEIAKDSEIIGSFTLILYGARHLEDIETVAILDAEGDKYELVPYAPEFDYKIIKNLSAKEALYKAQSFVSWYRSFHHSQLSKIVDDKGNPIGYELRPLYLPFCFGVSDVLEVDYWLKEDGKVKITIRLSPLIERLVPPAGDGSDGGGE